jgi:transposase
MTWCSTAAALGSQWYLARRFSTRWQKAAVALANKNARILWAVLAKNEVFDCNHVSVKPCVMQPVA